MGLAQLRFEGLLDQADLQGQCLQAAEGAEGLGLGVDAVLQGRREAPVGTDEGVGHDGGRVGEAADASSAGAAPSA